MNVFFILLNNFSLILFLKFINQPFASSNSQFKISQNSNILTFLIISFNFQGIHFISSAFTNVWKTKIDLIFLCIAMALCLITLIVIYRQCRVSLLIINSCLFIIIFSFYACIFDILIYNLRKLDFSIEQDYLKWALEIIVTIVTFRILMKFKVNQYVNQFKRNLFDKNKSGDEHVLILFEMLKNSVDDCSQIIKLLQIINSHKVKCQEDNCPCIHVDVKHVQEEFMNTKDISELNQSIKIKRFSEVMEYVLNLCECEIINAIYSLSRNNEIQKNFEILILHFDYIFYFKRNILFANYLVGQYTGFIKNLPFFFRYYLDIYRHKMIKDSIKGIERKSSGTNYHFFQFLKYHSTLDKLHKNFRKVCQDYEVIMAIKINYENRKIYKEEDMHVSNHKDSTFTEIQKLIKASKNLNRHTKKIELILEHNFKDRSLKKPEMCYLLFNYFTLFEKEIPFHLKRLFKEFPNYEKVCQFPSSYKDQKMNHPIIVGIKGEMSLPLIYISQKLCDMLGFKKNDLLNNDMHCLLPKMFENSHKILLSRRVLLDTTDSEIKKSFLITKDNFYFPVTIYTSFFPSLENNAMIIMDIFPKLAEISIDEKKYHLVLDYFTNFVSFSKNFQDDFFLTYEMISKLNINFSSFFDINIENEKTKLQPCLDKIISVDMNLISNSFKIFTQSEFNEFIFKKEKKLSVKNIKSLNSSRFLSYKKKKDKLIPSLKKLANSIQEAELPAEWMTRILLLEKKILSQINKSGVATTPKFNKVEKMNPFCFFIEMELRNVGNIPFFMVKIYDIEEKQCLTKDLSNYFLQNIGNSNQVQLDTQYKTFNKSKFFREENNLNNNLNSFATKGVLPLEHSLQSSNNVAVLGKPDENVKELKDSSNNNTSTMNNTTTNMNLKNFNESSNYFLKKNRGSLISDNKKLQDLIKKANSFKRHKNNDPANHKTTPLTKSKLIFMILIGLSVIILMCLSFVNFSIKDSSKQSGNIIFQSNFYGIGVRTSVVFGSSIVLLACEKSGGVLKVNQRNYVSSDYLNYLFNENSAKMLLSYYEFNQNLNNLDSKLLNQISAIYQQTNAYKVLHSNWQFYDRTDSNLENELKYFNYYIANLNSIDFNEKSSCRLKYFFFDKKYKIMADSSNNMPANIAEKVLFYIIENTMPIYEPQFFKIFESMTNYFVDNMISWSDILLFYELCNLLVAFCFLSAFLCFVLNFKKKIKILIIKFLDGSDTTVFVKLMANFKNLATSFDKQVCLDFEEKKFQLNCLKSYAFPETAQKQTDYYNENYMNNNFKKYLKPNASSYNKNESKLSNSYEVSKYHNESTINQFNTTNQKFMIDSGFKNSIFQYSQLTKQESSYFYLEPTDVKIFLVKCSYYFIVVGLMIYICFTVISILNTRDEIQKIIFCNQMADNFIRRIPKLAELALFYKVSIILNDPNFIKSNNTFSESADYFNYYNIQFDTETDSTYQILGDSKFAEIYYKLSLYTRNVDYFMSDEKKRKFMPKVYEYEKLLRSKGFCSHLITEIGNIGIQTEFFNENIVTDDDKCKFFGSEIQSNGFSTAINLLISTTRNIYLDFVTDQSNPRDNEKFLNNDDFVNSFNGIELIFRIIQENIKKNVMEDMNELFSKSIRNDIIISIMALNYNLILALFVIFYFMIKFEKIYFHIQSAIMKFKIAINHNTYSQENE